ncbi:MAG: hypothetical protein WCQ90_01710, partial [Deltaproteobacteria bacterium]
RDNAILFVLSFLFKYKFKLIVVPVKIYSAWFLLIPANTIKSHKLLIVSALQVLSKACWECVFMRFIVLGSSVYTVGIQIPFLANQGTSMDL